ncbi:2899_t:CDS:2, partial [Racocetra persica]
FNEAETNVNILFEVKLTIVKPTDHMLFVITENLPDSIYSTSKTLEELHNPLDRECCIKNMLQEMIQNATLLANSNSESVHEHKRQLQREVYARSTKTVKHAKERRAKRRKINHHTSKNTYIENRCLILLNNILIQQRKTLKDFSNIPVSTEVNDINNPLIAKELNYNYLAY